MHIMCNTQLLYLLHVGNHNAWLRFAAPHHSTPISPKYNLKVLFTYIKYCQYCHQLLYQPTLNSYTCTKGTTIPWQTASAPMLLYPNPPLHIPHNIRSQCSDCSLMWYLHISHLSTMWTPHPIRFRTSPTPPPKCPKRQKYISNIFNDQQGRTKACWPYMELEEARTTLWA